MFGFNSVSVCKLSYLIIYIMMTLTFSVHARGASALLTEFYEEFPCAVDDTPDAYRGEGGVGEGGHIDGSRSPHLLHRRRRQVQSSELSAAHLISDTGQQSGVVFSLISRSSHCMGNTY